MQNQNDVIDYEVIHNSNKEINVELLQFPSLLSRVKALILDSLVILFVFSIVSVLINLLGDIPSFLKGFILIFMFYLYDPLLTSFFGATLGHRIMSLTVRKYNNHDLKISLGKALLRFFLKLFLGWISFLTVTSSKQKRAIHDIVSGSIVIYKNK
ncbi:RDD family protein [Chryseotalea sanaruensis]|uniref:RDD family protein n=1 Tax=Chryseotalea sanaruensis TaxID=2482724 RepID=A0A401UA98_9BACT|nr:RDD family protein [Chryseotalea sanaruensis]GCC51819.1 RDD family protein [Chryseotalea sanaruensis]